MKIDTRWADIANVIGYGALLAGCALGFAMREAFNQDRGPLRDPAADGGERVARMELFAGAIGSFKNPHSHRDVNLAGLSP